MGALWDCSFGFLWNGQPGTDAFYENERQQGPANDSAHRIDHLIGGVLDLFALVGRTAYIPFLHCPIFAFQKQDCMNYTVQVKVMPLKELLDPQGKAVMGGLQNLGIKTVQDVRIGKTIQLQVEAPSSEEAKKIAADASNKLLANPVMEYFEISVL